MYTQAFYLCDVISYLYDVTTIRANSYVKTELKISLPSQSIYTQELLELGITINLMIPDSR